MSDLHSWMTPLTSPLWARFGVSFMSYTTRCIESTLYIKSMFVWRPWWTENNWAVYQLLLCWPSFRKSELMRPCGRYTSVNWVSIGEYNSLSCVWHQAIRRTTTEHTQHEKIKTQNSPSKEKYFFYLKILYPIFCSFHLHSHELTATILQVLTFLNPNLSYFCCPP